LHQLPKAPVLKNNITLNSKLRIMNSSSFQTSIKNTRPFAQLFLRLALGIGFIWPVMDRVGWLGASGSGGVAWGDWNTFVMYTNTLMPFLSREVTNIMALIATVAEIVFGLCLIVGFKIRIVALFSSMLTAIFAICMAIFISPDAPLNYPVFVFSGAHLLLATISSYRWSIDFYLEQNEN
jgi:putative oxidoreductase